MKISTLILCLTLLSACGDVPSGIKVDVDPIRIEDRVRAELDLQALKNKKTAFKTGSGIDSAYIAIGPFEDDAYVLIAGQNTVSTGKTLGRAELDVMTAPALPNGDSILFQEGTQGGCCTLTLKGQALVHIAKNNVVRISATGRNHNAYSGTVSLEAFFVDPSEFKHPE